MVITKWAPESFWSGNVHHKHCPSLRHKARRRCSSVGYKVKLWCVAFLGINVIHIGLLLRLNCQWHTDPKRWLNSALVSNPFPVTHNFLLTPQQLGQPAGEKTQMLLAGVRGGLGALGCAISPESLGGPQSVGVPPFADKRHGWGCLLCHGPSLILL